MKELKEGTVLKWIQHYWEGCDNLEDCARSGHLFTSCRNENIDPVYSFVLNEHQVTVKMISEAFGLTKWSVRWILTKN